MTAKQSDTKQWRGLSGDLREIALGNVDADHSDEISRVSGLIDDEEILDLLLFAERAYTRRRDADDPDFWDLDWTRRRVKRYATKTASKAVEDGNLSKLAYLVGSLDSKNDVSGMHTIRQLEDWLCHSDQAKLIYLAGLMGNGKTDWSLSMLEVVHWHYKRLRDVISTFGGSPSDVPEPQFAANFRVDVPDDVDARVRYLPDYDRLAEWGEQGSSDMVRWFIFDEASTELTAQSGSNAQDVAEVFAPFVKKMRKMGINMIVIGHDKGDVHVAIRSIADFVSKPGLRKATVYSGIKNREPAGELFTLDNIPKTTWDYDTDDLADWSWGSALDDVEEGVDPEDYLRDWRNERIRTLYSETDMTQEDLGRVFDLSDTMVGKIVNKNDGRRAVA